MHPHYTLQYERWCVTRAFVAQADDVLCTARHAVLAAQHTTLAAEPGTLTLSQHRMLALELAWWRTRTHHVTL